MINSNDMQEKAKAIVYEYAKEKLDKTDYVKFKLMVMYSEYY